MSKRFAELSLISGFFFLACALYYSTSSYPNSVQGSTAVYVRFLALSLSVFCFIQLLFWFNKKSQKKDEKIGIVKDPLKFWGLLILLIMYSIFLGYIGFYVSSLFFLPISMLVLGSRNYKTVGLTTTGVIAFIYLVFATLLEVPLPEATLF